MIFPVAEEARGQAFLDHVAARRRFYFDNYFKRVLHRPTGDPLRPTDDERRRGFIVFQRDLMKDVFANDTPLRTEKVDTLRAEAFAGEYEPITLGVVPLRDLGKVAVGISDLTGPGGTIPAGAIEPRVRLQPDQPRDRGGERLHDPSPLDHARRDRGRSRGPDATILADGPHARPMRGRDSTRGRSRSALRTGDIAQVPVEFRVRAGTLDPVDIPAGPFGYQIGIPWYDDDPRAAEFNRTMNERGLRKMREYGFTAFSGMPTIAYRGFSERQARPRLPGGRRAR